MTTVDRKQSLALYGLLSAMISGQDIKVGAPRPEPVPTGPDRPDRDDPAKVEAAERKRRRKAEKRHRQYINSVRGG